MTTIESYYLAVCAAAFFIFAITLAYNVSSWKTWKQSRTAETDVAKPVVHAEPEAKLAA